MATTDPMRLRSAAIAAAKYADTRLAPKPQHRLTPGRLAAIVDAVIAVLNIEQDDAERGHIHTGPDCDYCYPEMP